jgi:alanine racemase
LRQGGITTPVLVLGGVLERQVVQYLTYDLTMSVTSLSNLLAIEATAESMGRVARVHIKVDTGMARLGVPYYEALPLLGASLSCSHVRVEGIYSHFANSDSADLTHARLQIERFEEVCSFYEKHSLPMPMRHLANSGGILALPESYYEMVRPGIMLYGSYPSADVARSVAIRPALTWKTRAVFEKVLPPFHPVSYGSTWQSDHPVRILTLPVGYGDGYFRLLSNKAPVIVRGRRYPQVGRVCMDQMMVNLEKDPADVGEEVLLIGEAGKVKVTADELAELIGTISYEIFTNINTRVPRAYVDEVD